MPLNLLWIIDLIQENFYSLIIILLSTVRVVLMDVYQVGEGLKFLRGITHVVLEM